MAQEAARRPLSARFAAALLAVCLAVPAAALAQPARKTPGWAQLTVEQQEILAPLKADWERIEPDQRRKWIGIAKRFPKMTPVGQKRVQSRMEKWVKLSPEQRRQARENYKRIAKVPPDKRGDLRQQWAEYQALPPHERQSLAPPADSARKKK